MSASPKRASFDSVNINKTAVVPESSGKTTSSSSPPSASRLRCCCLLLGLPVARVCLRLHSSPEEGAEGGVDVGREVDELLIKLVAFSLRRRMSNCRCGLALMIARVQVDVVVGICCISSYMVQPVQLVYLVHWICRRGDAVTG
ncbi:hypothetical protein ACP70R_007729 [Stipagrostis hirtigluma subsp. patula]